MKKVVFTFIINGYDTLKDPTIVTPGWDYLCFSDEGLSSEVPKILTTGCRASTASASQVFPVEGFCEIEADTCSSTRHSSRW